MSGWPAPLAPVLAGRLVRLEPLRPEHAAQLARAGDDESVWRWLQGGRPASFEEWVAAALTAAGRGEEAPFATVDTGSGEAVGSTRFLELRPAHRGLEIGWTWLSPRLWGTGANAEAKLLQLEHAFERLGCERVEFKTDALNDRSRAALDALPARFEGVRRRHLRRADGTFRDSAYYSIVRAEWPEVRANLERRLQR